MEPELTKEQFSKYVDHKKLEKIVRKKCEEIVGKIAIEIQDIFKRGKYMVMLDFAEARNKVTIEIVINGVNLDKIECDYDIMYSEASLLIELRNVKDVLYEARKRIAEPAPTFWQKLFGG